MTRRVRIDTHWDVEAQVWLVTAWMPGLVVEAETWPAMLEEIRLVLPDLLELSSR